MTKKMLKQKNGGDGFARLLVVTLAVMPATYLLTAALTRGYSYDVGCFTAWALRMAEVPAAEFYAPDYFADYPPGYMLVLKLLGQGMKRWHMPYGSRAAAVLLTLPSVLGGCVLTWLLSWGAYKKGGREFGLAMLALTAANPMLWFNAAVWKQVDVLFSLLVVACFWLLEERRWMVGAVMYGLALAMKPQALLAGPVLAVAFLLPVLKKEGRGRAVARLFGGAAAAVAVALLPGVPFWGWKGCAAKTVEKYFATVGGYEYAGTNAANLMAALGANWQSWHQKFLFVSWKGWGTVWILLLTAGACLLGAAAAKRGTFDSLLLAGVYTVGLFVLGHGMHERYLVFGVVLVLAAAARLADRRLLRLGAGFSAVALVNQWLVYATVDSADPFLQTGPGAVLLKLCGWADLALFVLLVAVTLDRMTDMRLPKWLKMDVTRPAVRAPKLQNIPAPQKNRPKFTVWEGALLAAATLLLGALSLAELGDTDAPQTMLEAKNTQISFSAQVQTAPAEIWLYTGIPQDGTVWVIGPDGTEAGTAELKYTTAFGWQRLELTGASAGTYEFVLENGQLLEAAFRDENGRLLAVECAQAAVFDEQAAVPDEISWRNSMYFDEIYHARTAYEMLHGLPIYETTHPPLGKGLIMMGIGMFGMTAFGWRFAGAVCGMLMLPALYLLVRRLSRSRGMAALAGWLLAFDLMRFGQSRIATIDSFATLFILCSGLCMAWYCDSVREKGVCGSILPMALCGAAFGLGAAAKWTGLYAGVGLALLYFTALYRRRKAAPKGFEKEFGAAIAGGFGFFVALPLVIYIAAYLPYFVAQPGFGLAEWWACQGSMLRYHGGLTATHPYQSMWYTWPLDMRPVWYYYHAENGAYSSISGMANPIVCWAGGAAAVYTLVRVLRKKATDAQTLLLVLYLTQLLPWAMVTRCAFLYHYFPSLVFSVGLAVLAVQQLTEGHAALRRGVCIGLAVAAAAVFVWFYPAVSGMPVGLDWARSVKWLDSWVLYPV